MAATSMYAVATRVPFRSCSAHLFDHLNSAAALRLDEIETLIHLPRGATLFTEDQRANRIFVVCDGQLKISTLAADGRITIQRLATTGAILGLSAALNYTLYEATAETMQPTTLKSIGRPEFLHLLHHFAEVGERTSQALASECSLVLRDARRLTLPGSASTRLARLLIDLATTSAGTTPDAFPMLLTHEDLANMTRMSRETMTRLLNQFERSGLLARRGTAFSILKPNRMAVLAS